MQDLKYRDFSARLTPSVEKELFIGVRIPEIRKLAKELPASEAEKFISVLPHQYVEEYQLHSFIIGKISDFERAIYETERFLPCVDNWAVCDSFSPKVFAKHKSELLIHTDKWLASSHAYTVRFGIKMLMEHFLGDNFSEEFPRKVALIKSDEYYVKMMVAWYFATALAKQYDSVISYMENRLLDPEIHKMTVRKALDSYRISDERKKYIRSL